MAGVSAGVDGVCLLGLFFSCLCHVHGGARACRAGCPRSSAWDAPLFFPSPHSSCSSTRSLRRPRALGWLNARVGWGITAPPGVAAGQHSPGVAGALRAGWFRPPTLLLGLFSPPQRSSRCVGLPARPLEGGERCARGGDATRHAPPPVSAVACFLGAAAPREPIHLPFLDGRVRARTHQRGRSPLSTELLPRGWRLPPPPPRWCGGARRGPAAALRD